MLKRFRAVAVLSASVLSTAAMAAGPLQVVSKILVEQRVRAADGSTSVTLAVARKVVPGDRITFVLAYRNTGVRPIAGLVLDNPVPQGIAYRGPSSNSVAPEVSVDGRTYGPLATLKVRTSTTVRAATTDDVTHVRWRLTAPVIPGAQGQVSFRAILK